MFCCPNMTFNHINNRVHGQGGNDFQGNMPLCLRLNNGAPVQGATFEWTTRLLDRKERPDNLLEMSKPVFWEK